MVRESKYRRNQGEFALACCTCTVQLGDTPVAAPVSFSRAHVRAEKTIKATLPHGSN